MISSARHLRKSPAALVLNAVNPIMVQGAAFADFTMIGGRSEGGAAVHPGDLRVRP